MLRILGARSARRNQRLEMADDPFDRNPAVVYGVAEPVAPRVRRVVARNPSPMTFTGTASYLVGHDQIAVIDPGPDDAEHRAALCAAAGPGRITAILVTHSHRDHSAGAAKLAAITDAPVCAFGPHGAGMSAAMRALRDSAPDLGGGEGGDTGFRPTRLLAEGEAVESDEWRLEALHTPGHLSNHLCYALSDCGALFTGDQVMGWATTMVSPPEGDMAAFMASLERLRDRAARGVDGLYLPGHGAPVRDPLAMTAWQLEHRRAREAQIVQALERGPADVAALTSHLYADVDRLLWPAAQRTVLAHLLALTAQGRAGADGPPGPSALFSLRRG